ncbi:hypothetical protein WP8W18C01_12540 [Pseudomonas putida]|uniref:Uncharacterized protein n=1 Tax=Pseudomonas putida TaxID=303 RepID=A0A6S5TLG2_PSEPU|nr:hypothetical protein WP8W18C01_12540 [Pseudomonas putida]
MAGIQQCFALPMPSWGVLVVRGPSSAILLTASFLRAVHLLFIEELNCFSYLITDRSALSCTVNGWLRDTYSLRDSTLRETPFYQLPKHFLDGHCAHLCVSE